PFLDVRRLGRHLELFEVLVDEGVLDEEVDDLLAHLLAAAGRVLHGSAVDGHLEDGATVDGGGDGGRGRRRGGRGQLGLGRRRWRRRGGGLLALRRRRGRGRGGGLLRRCGGTRQAQREGGETETASREHDLSLFLKGAANGRAGQGQRRRE